MRKILFILSLFLLFHVPSWAQDTQQASARIVKTRGSVNCKATDSDRFYQAFVGQSTYVGDRVQTLNDSVALVEFRVGGLAGVSPNSVIEILGGRQIGQVSGEYQLESGGVWVNVKKRQDSTFTIQTKSGMLGVRGTEFIIVQRPDGEVDIAVLEGTVDWTPSQSKTTLQVGQGQRVLASANTGIPSSIQQLGAEACAQQMRQQYFPNLSNQDIQQLGSFKSTGGLLNGFSDNTPVAQAQASGGSRSAGGRTALSQSSSAGVSSAVQSNSSTRSGTRLRTSNVQTSESSPAVVVEVGGTLNGYGANPYTAPSSVVQGPLSNAIATPSVYQAGRQRRRTNNRRRVQRLNTAHLDATALNQQSSSFHWSKSDGADSYVLLVSASDDFSELVWSTTTQQTNVAYPSNAKPLAPGTYYVQVSSVQNGKVVGQPQQVQMTVK